MHSLGTVNVPQQQNKPVYPYANSWLPVAVLHYLEFTILEIQESASA